MALYAALTSEGATTDLLFAPGGSAAAGAGASVVSGEGPPVKKKGGRKKKDATVDGKQDQDKGKGKGKEKGKKNAISASTGPTDDLPPPASPSASKTQQPHSHSDSGSLPHQPPSYLEQDHSGRLSLPASSSSYPSTLTPSVLQHQHQYQQPQYAPLEATYESGGWDDVPRQTPRPDLASMPASVPAPLPSSSSF